MDLLVEAERRCLLDDVTSALLAEARGRGLVGASSQQRCGATDSFQVELLGMQAIERSLSKDAGDFHSGQATDAAERALCELLQNTASAAGMGTMRRTPKQKPPVQSQLQRLNIRLLPTGLGLFKTMSPQEAATTRQREHAPAPRVCFSPAAQAVAVLPLPKMDSVEIFDKHLVIVMQEPPAPATKAQMSPSHRVYALSFQSAMQAESCAEMLRAAIAEWPKEAGSTKRNTYPATPQSVSGSTFSSSKINQSVNQSGIFSSAQQQQHSRTLTIPRPLGFECISTANVRNANLEPGVFISKVVPGSNASKVGLVEGLEIVQLDGNDDIVNEIEAVFAKETVLSPAGVGGMFKIDAVQLTAVPNPTGWAACKTAVKRNLKSDGGERTAPQLKYPARAHEKISFISPTTASQRNSRPAWPANGLPAVCI